MELKQRLLAEYYKKDCPDLKAITENGEYIIKLGDLEVLRYSDRTTGMLASWYIQEKVQQEGYKPVVHYQE